LGISEANEYFPRSPIRPEQQPTNFTVLGDALPPHHDTSQLLAPPRGEPTSPSFQPNAPGESLRAEPNHRRKWQQTKACAATKRMVSREKKLFVNIEIFRNAPSNVAQRQSAV
jgi:hypothetical protein